MTDSISGFRNSGNNVKGVSFYNHKYFKPSKLIRKFNLNRPLDSFSNMFEFIFTYPIFFVYTMIQLYRSDIIYWIQEPPFPKMFWLKYTKLLNKKNLVEYIGGDIRCPQILMKINPFYREVLSSGNYEYHKIDNNGKKSLIQKQFSSIKAIPIVNHEMSLFLNKGFHSNFILAYTKFDVKSITPIYPSKNNSKPLIIHSPTAPYAKGSNIIREVINRLEQSFEFEYKMLYNMPKDEVSSFVEKCDIFIDQIIIGSYGLSSIEAMAYGKPSMCYILDEVFENGLDRDCPIVNVNPDTFEEALINLLKSPNLRHSIGIKSRQFVEKYHDTLKICEQILNQI